MRSLKSFLVDYVSIILWPCVGVVMAMVFGPPALGRLVGITAEVIEGTGVSRAIFLSYLGVATFCFNTMTWQRVPELARRARLMPRSSRFVANCLLATPTLGTMLLNAATMLGYRIIFGSSWPIVTTTLWFGASTVLCAAGIAWVRHVPFSRAILFPITVAVWLCWIVFHYYPNGFREGMTFWREFSGVDLLVTSGVTIGAWLVFQSSFQKYREGTSQAKWLNWLLDPHPSGLVAGMASADDSSRERSSIGSPQQAFLSMIHEHTKILSLVMSIMFCTAFGGMVFTLLSAERNPLEPVLNLTPVFGGLSGLLIGMVLVPHVLIRPVGSSAIGKLRTNVATLPMSDSETGRLILQSWLPPFYTASVCYVAAVIIAFAVHAGIYGPLNYRQLYLELPIVQNLGLAAGVLPLIAAPIITWTTGGIVGGLVLSGHRRLGLAAVVSVPLTSFIVALLHQLGGATGAMLADALLVGLSLVVCGGVSCWLLWIALKRELVSVSQTTLCVLGAAILYLSIWSLLPGEPMWKLIWSGFATLAIAPVPGVPLALARNRHQ